MDELKEIGQIFLVILGFSLMIGLVSCLDGCSVNVNGQTFTLSFPEKEK